MEIEGTEEDWSKSNGREVVGLADEVVVEVEAGEGMMVGGEVKRCLREVVGGRSGLMEIVDEVEGLAG